MVKLRHARTGGDIWVHESRLEEYLAAGHKLAAPPVVPKTEKKPVAKKATAKKATPKTEKVEEKVEETEEK